MGATVPHPPGSVCWLELQTTDPEGAKAFYSGLLGWQMTDDTMGQGTYTKISLGGGDVGGLYGGAQEPIGPRWIPYMLVLDAQQAIAAAQGAGGVLEMGPYEPGGKGVMAWLKDSVGARFGIFQPKSETGMDIVDGRHGAMVWCDLASRDPEVATGFYSGVFGWMASPHGDPASGYTVFGLSSEPSAAGGMYQLTDAFGDTPSHWTIYFSVNDVEASAAQAEALGGTVLMPPTDFPGVGRFSLVQDPQGARFAIMTMGQAGG